MVQLIFLHIPYFFWLNASREFCLLFPEVQAILSTGRDELQGEQEISKPAQSSSNSGWCTEGFKNTIIIEKDQNKTLHQGGQRLKSGNWPKVY